MKDVSYKCSGFIMSDDCWLYWRFGSHILHAHPGDSAWVDQSPTCFPVTLTHWITSPNPQPSGDSLSLLPLLLSLWLISFDCPLMLNRV